MRPLSNEEVMEGEREYVLPAIRESLEINLNPFCNDAEKFNC